MNQEKFRHLLFMRRFFSEGLTTSERQANIDKILQENPLTNKEVWFYTLSKRGYLTKPERSKILNYYETYKELWPNQEISVAILLDQAGIKGLENNKYLKKVCFNYERGLDAYNRFEKAMQEMKDRKRKSVGAFDFDPTYWSVERWAKDDFGKLSADWAVSFDATNNKFLPNRDYLSIAHLEHSIFRHEQELLPLLQAGEIIKAGFENPFISGDLNQQPKIIDSFLPLASSSLLPQRC